MIYLKLFLVFLKIGIVSFGGGYGMISLIREDCLNYGWLTENELLHFIALAESTPGPIAVNMATFVGSSQGGILGAFLATLGVILPSFIIILFIVMFFKHILKYAGVRAILDGIRPAIVGLVFATAWVMFFSLILNMKTIESKVSLDWRALGIFIMIFIVSLGYAKRKKKKVSPIILIVLSGILGIIFYGI